MTSQKVQNMREPKIVARLPDGKAIVRVGTFDKRILALEISSLCGVNLQVNDEQTAGNIPLIVDSRPMSAACREAYSWSSNNVGIK